jgi:RimJ/RimL family protein N-acetyltransferase
MQVEVRPAVAADAPAMGRVHVLSWQAAYPGLISQDYLDGLDVGERVEHWRRAISRLRELTPLLVAVTGDDLVGFAGFGPVRGGDSPPPTVGELYGIDVRPDVWGRGVGAALLAAVHRGLAEHGYRRAVLWVLPGNRRARTVYEHYGWRPDGVNRTAEVFGVTVPETRYWRRLP